MLRVPHGDDRNAHEAAAATHGGMASAVDHAPADSGLVVGAGASRDELFGVAQLGQQHRGQPSDGEGTGSAPKDVSSASVSPQSPSITPPYWLSPNTHQRNISSTSTESVPPIGAITLQDNEASEQDERNKACWAKSVEIVDHTVVNGSATNVGAFVVWIIRVETLNVGLPLIEPCWRSPVAFFSGQFMNTED